MDTCSEHKEKQLRDYFLNRLSPEEVESFQFHLFHCTSCQKNLERMRRLAYGEEAPAQSFSDQKVSSGKEQRIVFTFWMRIAAIVGLLLIIAGGGYYYLSTPVEEDWQIEINEVPVLHSGDSVQVDIDSTTIEKKEREIKDGK